MKYISSQVDGIILSSQLTLFHAFYDFIAKSLIKFYCSTGLWSDVIAKQFY